jgi:uncharacterized protein YihD (DUF1040 family)
MRDPARIDRMLAALKKAWKENPDMRLGQLIVNVAGKNDPYFIEDDVTETRLTQVVLNGWPGTRKEQKP